MTIPSLYLMVALLGVGQEPSMSSPNDPGPAVRLVVADARLQQLRSLTPLPPGPPVLEALATAEHLGFVVAPKGHTLGVTARGSGEAFCEALATLTGELLHARAAQQVRTIGAQVGHQGLVAEVAIGTAGWMWIGATGVDHDLVHTLLKKMAVTIPEQARLLHEDGTTVTGVAVFSDGIHPAGVAVTHTINADKGIHTLTRVEGQPELKQVRGAGLHDRALIDWMVTERIATKDSLQRIGAAHSILETTGPHTMVWQAADHAGTVVFLYDNPVP